MCLPLFNVQWGNTPLLRAVVKGHAEVARFLLDSGSVFDERNNVSALKQASPIVFDRSTFLWPEKMCACGIAGVFGDDI